MNHSLDVLLSCDSFFNVVPWQRHIDRKGNFQYSQLLPLHLKVSAEYKGEQRELEEKVKSEKNNIIILHIFHMVYNLLSFSIVLHHNEP